jgi:phospholipid/cholesterol/gamma-HCH transport system substrate-binding protein
VIRSDGTGGFSVVGRVAAAGALILALVVIALVVLANQTSYTLHAVFQNASGLVTGNSVLVGPAQVGTVNSIGLTRNGSAEVTMSLQSDAAPVHQGTVARIYEDSLSGIASKYVELEPGSQDAPAITDGGVIDQNHTYSSVNLDQVFDTLDPLTRKGLQNVVRGEAASLQGAGHRANQALRYLAPGLQSTSQVTAELARDQPVFDKLISDGAQTMQALASKSQQLTQLISDTSTATGAIARQSQALEDALTLLPGTLTRGATTFAGLRTTLDALAPLVAASKPAVRRLPEFATRLGTLVDISIPTVAELNRLIHNPAGTGDLTQLALEAPGLARTAAAAFPRLIKEMNDSQAQLDYLRNYTPDVVGALTNLGQIGATFDANGHYTRTQPALFPFTLNGANQLTMQFPSQRYQGLHSVRNRCPGSAIQPSPDGSAPQPVPGCSTSSVLPGP